MAVSDGEASPDLLLSGSAGLLLHDLLHAMGQPLTTLQLCRMPAARGGSGEQPFLEVIAGQIETLTEVYRALRALVAGCEGSVEPVPTEPMLRRLCSDWDGRAARQ